VRAVGLTAGATNACRCARAFAETVRALPARLLGANVTIPHKEAALALADEATAAARAIGAANT
jgi:shikimate 5-dehydrogenase